MHECCPEHLHMGKARFDKGTEEGKQRSENMERSKVDTK